ncbi:MAG: Stp1/IreP family PP2C-type Ser/Thr phosphatase [Proteobacteria bacterium]|nr:Stp1/IreP family PP2C-type Ser/Thr phosphatase [Pseudomonadota bacterium]
MSQDQAQLKIAGFTDAGLRRSHNEDHIGFNQNLGIAVLADGMGGHQAGEIAAHMAVESVLENLQYLINQKTLRSITGSQLLRYVSHTISHSNRLIYQAAKAHEERRGMGTTLVAAIVTGSRIYAGHVGDSRLYLYRNQTLRRITKDHSLAQDLVDKGFYTEEEARTANVGHLVTRALGTEAEVDVDTVQHDLEQDDLLLLCSDGLSDMVTDRIIEKTLDKHPGDLEKTARALVALANEFGGRDNISVILMQLQPKPDHAAETE